jgi:hypothetical protein
MKPEFADFKVTHRPFVRILKGLSRLKRIGNLSKKRLGGTGTGTRRQSG